MQAVPDGYQGALLLTLFCTLAGVAVDPQALMTRATCLECGMDGMEDLVAIDLLRQIAGASSDPNVLANDASCIDCNVPSGFRMEVLLSVACLMAQNGPIQTNDPDVAAFIGPAGITDKATIDALNALVITLKKLLLWTSFDAIYPFVGGTANSNSYNLVNPANYQITWHGAMTFDPNGITGDGLTGYGDTGFNPSTATAPKYLVASSSVGFYSRNAAVNVCVFGVLTDSTDSGLNTDAALCQSEVNGLNATGQRFNSIIDGLKGFYASTVTGAASRDLYNTHGVDHFNDVPASTALPNKNFLISRTQFPGVQFFDFVNLAFAFIGSGFTQAQVALLQAAILTFETSLGRA